MQARLTDSPGQQTLRGFEGLLGAAAVAIATMGPHTALIPRSSGLLAAE
jgi:hypothetical protein